jgi:hypothetical protein
MRFTVVAVVVFAFALPLFAQLPAPPPPRFEIFAGQTFTQAFPVACITGSGARAAAAPVAMVDVTVEPAGVFKAIASPARVSPGDNVTVTAAVPVTAPSQEYKLTIRGIRISGDCNSGSSSFMLLVKRPLRLDIQGPSSVTTSAGSAAGYEILIRGRSLFGGRVEFRTPRLKKDFEPVFTPPATTGANTTLTIRTPVNPTECFEPNGCDFDIRGDTGAANVQVEATTGNVTLRREVVLRAAEPVMKVDPGQTAKFKLDILRFGYSGPIQFEAALVDPPGGSFAEEFKPGTVNSETSVMFEVRVDPTKPGVYRFKVKAKDTGVREVPAEVVVDTNRSSILVTPPAQTINRRESAMFDIRLLPIEGESIQLDGAAASPLGGVFPELVTVNGQQKLKVTANADAVLRTYNVTVNGTVTKPGGGGAIASAPVDVAVTDNARRVVLEADPEIISLGRGATFTGDLRYSALGNYEGTVDLSVTPAPPQGGVGIVVPPSFRIGDGSPSSGKVPFQLTVDPNAPLTGEDPLQYVVTPIPDPPANTDSATIKYRVVSSSQPMLSVMINQPPNQKHFKAGEIIPFEVETRRDTRCNQPPKYTVLLVPQGVIATPAFPDEDTPPVSMVVAPALMETRKITINITAMSPPCLSSGDTIDIFIDKATPIPPPLATATLAPAGRTIQRGQSAAYTLTVNRSGGTGPIAVAIAGLPSGVSATITPNPLPADTAQIVLAASSAAPAGTFTFTVNASLGGAPLASVNGSLTITAPPPPNLPAITSFTPVSGTAGAQVQIFGTNLTNVQNVLFSSSVGAAFAPISPNQVNATVPGFAMTGPITVITAGGTAVSATPFIVGTQSQAPQITTFTPTSGPAGTSVRLQGVNLANPFDVSLGTPALGFMPIAFVPFDATRIDVIIPPGVPSGFFRVATPGGTATSAAGFNVTTPNLPQIGGFNPISGPPGTRVEIIGVNLQGATQVAFGGVPASFEPPQPERIFATVPPAAPTGQIRVTTPNGTATSFASFAVTSGGPVITDIQPRMGSEGFSVTIAGANLSNASEVTFNGVRAVIGIVTPNFVQAFVPAGATTGPVRITTPVGSATSPFAFTLQ